MIIFSIVQLARKKKAIFFIDKCSAINYCIEKKNVGREEIAVECGSFCNMTFRILSMSFKSYAKQLNLIKTLFVTA